MDWIKKHVDTVIILGAVVSSVLWMNGKFNDMSDKMNDRFMALEKDITIIKTVLVMKNIMPQEMAKCEKETK